MRGELRNMEEAIAAGDQSVAAEQLKTRTAGDYEVCLKGIIHKNTASRKMSRLSARVKALGA